MSKDADKEPAQTGRDRPRRRKKTGIRIPSDNVPRVYPNGESDSAIARPATSDPNIDISIPHDFDEDDEDDELTEFVDGNGESPDLERAKTIQMPAFQIDDAMLDGDADGGRMTREMPAFRLEDFGLEPMDAPLASGVPEPIQEPLAGMPSVRIMPRKAARQVAAAEDVDVSVDIDVQPASVEPEAESVDIDIDVNVADVPASDGNVADVPANYVSRAPTMALSEDDLEEIIDAASDIDPEIIAHIRRRTSRGGAETASDLERGERDGSARPRSGPTRPRATLDAESVAHMHNGAAQLGDVGGTREPFHPAVDSVYVDDSADLHDGALEAAGPSAASDAAMRVMDVIDVAPHVAALADESAEVEPIDVPLHFESDEPLPLAPVFTARDAAPAKAVEPSRATPPEPGLPAAIAAIEGKSIESPFGERAAQDSGEILSDELADELAEELIEEVNDSELLQQRAAPPAPPAPPATPAVVKAVKPPPAPRPDAAPVAKKGRKGKPWFEEIFDEDYLRTLPFLTPQATQSEAGFVAEALEIAPGGQLLDVGCGYGRHAMELAARGYHIVALDASLPLLLRGADEAQRRGLTINFVHGDMRELTFDSQFDGAYCLFSTFGYFDDETNKKTAQCVARALKPGGRLVIEVLNRDYLIADLPSRVWWEGDGCVVLEEVDFNYFSSRVVSNRSVVFDDGRQLEQEISLRAYSLHEFGKLLHSAGMRVLEISGSMATRGRFFGNQSREIIVVAEKRTAKDTVE